MTPLKGTRLECGKSRDIPVPQAVAEIIAKIILECLKEHLEGLINREQTGFRSGPSCKSSKPS